MNVRGSISYVGFGMYQWPGGIQPRDAVFATFVGADAEFGARLHGTQFSRINGEGPTYLISEDSMKIRVRIEPKGTRYRKTGRTYFAKMTSVVKQQPFKKIDLKIFRLPI